MSLILGIDPGSRITGYGLVQALNGKVRCVDYGCIKLGTGRVEQRLATLFQELLDISAKYEPVEVAIEKVFVGKSMSSALKLGQARGVALMFAGRKGLPTFEYSPTEIKKATVGRGHADKVQVQHMMKVLVGLQSIPPSDAADALAVAICHAHTSSFTGRLSDFGAEQ